MPPRVALVIGQLQQGGAEGQLVHLARGMPRDRYEPVVACLSEVSEPHGPLLISDGITVRSFARSGRADSRRVMALAALLRDEKIDLVHSFLVGANSYAYAATQIARHPRLIASSRTTMEIPSAPARMVHRWVFRHAAAVVANSGSVRDFTASYYGVPPGRIRVIRNGVVTGGVMPAGERRRRREALGAGDEDLLVATLGRLSPEKNLRLFVGLAARLAGTAPRARFVIAGDGPERSTLEALIRSSGLEGRVILAGARSDARDFLAAMDLFVLTSGTEGLPNAVMEAMSAGLAVVASRVGGTHEVVEEGSTGHLVEAGDERGFAEAISRLLQDPAARARMGRAGMERMEREFSVSRMVEETCRLYDEVTGRGS